MTSYRRSIVPGGSYFFTVNLADRRRELLTQHIDALRAAFRYARGRYAFTIEAIVVLPDHLHAIWTLPDGDTDFAVRWRLIKSTFSRALPPDEPVSPSRARKAERGIWQRRHWEHDHDRAKSDLSSADDTYETSRLDRVFRESQNREVAKACGPGQQCTIAAVPNQSARDGESQQPAQLCPADSDRLTRRQHSRHPLAARAAEAAYAQRRAESPS